MHKFIKRQRLTLHILTAFVLFIALFLASCGNKDNRRGAYYNQNRAAQQRANNFPRYQGPLTRPRPGAGSGMDPFMTKMLEMQLKASGNSKDFGKTALIAAGVGGAAGIGVGIIAAIAASSGSGKSSLPPPPPLGGCSGGGVGCGGRGAGSFSVGSIGSPCPYAVQSGGPGVFIAGGACVPPPGSPCTGRGGVAGQWNNQGGCAVVTYYAPPPPPPNPCDDCQNKGKAMCYLYPEAQFVLVPVGGGNAPYSSGRVGGSVVIGGGSAPNMNPSGQVASNLDLGRTGYKRADRKYEYTEERAMDEIAQARKDRMQRGAGKSDEIRTDARRRQLAAEVLNDIDLMMTVMADYPDQLKTPDNLILLNNLNEEYKSLLNGVDRERKWAPFYTLEDPAEVKKRVDNFQ